MVFSLEYIARLPEDRYRVEHPREVELLSMSPFFIDYPFAGRLFPAALKVLKRLCWIGPTVIFSDGDVVFQPHKVERAGLSDAVDRRVRIYIHKEEALDDVETALPSRALRLFGREAAHLGGGQAILGRTRDHRVRAAGHLCSRSESSPIERIADLLGCDLPRLWPAPPVPASRRESTR
jgi:hypothetical protein